MHYAFKCLLSCWLLATSCHILCLSGNALISLSTLKIRVLDIAILTDSYLLSKLKIIISCFADLRDPILFASTFVVELVFFFFSCFETGSRTTLADLELDMTFLCFVLLLGLCATSA